LKSDEQAKAPPLKISLRRLKMKKLISLIIALGLFAVFATAATEPVLKFRITADIPFEFMVGKKKMPKGEYTIESINETGTIQISKVKGGKAINFMAIKDKITDKHKSKLVFRRYGDQYFLARIWDGSSETVFKIEKSSAEKKVAKMFKDKSGKDEDEVPVGDR